MARYPLGTIAVAFVFAAASTSSASMTETFDSYSGAATTWGYSSDSDPPTYPASPWFIEETSITQVALMATTGNLSGSGANYPSWAAASSPNFLHVHVGGASQAQYGWLQLDAVTQAQIASTQAAVISFDLFGLSGHDGWSAFAQVTAWDGPASTFAAAHTSSRAVDLEFEQAGLSTFTDGPVKEVTPTGGFQLSPSQYTTIAGLATAFKVNQWNHVVMDLNFASDTYTVSINGVTSPTLNFRTPLSSIQSISFAIEDGRNAVRVGYDNIIVVPEPGSLSLLALGAFLTIRRRQS